MSSEDEVINEMYKKFRELGSVENFMDDLPSAGIQKNDPRIEKLTKSMKREEKERKEVDIETFTRCISPYSKFMMKMTKNELILPDFEEFTKYVTDLYDLCKINMRGNNADYIPQLETIPNHWGVSVCSVDGQRFSIGDTKIPFTIQSCSKPLSYAVALEYLTSEKVHEYIGQEPSGRVFNEMVLDHNKKPHNPMINAGAIVTASLLHNLVKPELSTGQKFDLVKSWMEKAAGGERFGFNNSIFLSEREGADRNFALGYFMKEMKVFPPNTKLLECLDFYFQLCSIESTAEAFSVVAATLANGGVCPTTEEVVFKPETVRDVLTLMHSCGLYDYSGQFAFKVGLPAKSGVSGIIMLIIPNLIGICCYSPKLDSHGNSVRGVEFCESLLHKYALHPYENLRHTKKRLLRNVF